mmetsp:Transcript_4357/g.9421  ORF Transcript_4357/g.9421 Transcript_4357/m.9421 type:complete len:108 (+) Transcript_4357:341-664(+)
MYRRPRARRDDGPAPFLLRQNRFGSCFAGIELWHARLFVVHRSDGNVAGEKGAFLTAGYWMLLGDEWRETFVHAKRTSLAEANLRSSPVHRDELRQRLRAEAATAAA